MPKIYSIFVKYFYSYFVFEVLKTRSFNLLFRSKNMSWVLYLISNNNAIYWKFINLLNKSFFYLFKFGEKSEEKGFGLRKFKEIEFDEMVYNPKDHIFETKIK